jgi:hypothetical protein
VHLLNPAYRLRPPGDTRRRAQQHHTLPHQHPALGIPAQPREDFEGVSCPAEHPVLISEAGRVPNCGSQDRGGALWWVGAQDAHGVAHLLQPEGGREADYSATDHHRIEDLDHNSPRLAGTITSTS